MQSARVKLQTLWSKFGILSVNAMLWPGELARPQRATFGIFDLGGKPGESGRVLPSPGDFWGKLSKFLFSAKKCGFHWSLHSELRNRLNLNVFCADIRHCTTLGRPWIYFSRDIVTILREPQVIETRPFPRIDYALITAKTHVKLHFVSYLNSN